MGVAYTACRTYLRRLDYGQIVVEGFPVESVVAYGIADLFLVHAVTVEVSEKIAVELIGIRGRLPVGTAAGQKGYSRKQ